LVGGDVEQRLAAVRVEVVAQLGSLRTDLAFSRLNGPLMLDALKVRHRERLVLGNVVQAVVRGVFREVYARRLTDALGDGLELRSGARRIVVDLAGKVDEVVHVFGVVKPVV